MGEFDNDLFNGKGDYTYSNGDIYEGDWVNGNAHGKGKYVFANQHVRNFKEKISDERIVKEPGRSTPTSSRESKSAAYTG